ncbi:MAG: hypothetical protein KatS3mg032_1891 [Cyclobacteriaceae bacterium]|nr:MAG: hypothetical protein KatS3mg032_1891 [Cyclobacteriaceae bacterium]
MKLQVAKSVSIQMTLITLSCTPTTTTGITRA